MLPTERPRPLAAPFYDVSRDGMISPRDLLIEIYYLNTVGIGSAEGESVVEPETVLMLPLLESSPINVLVNAKDEGDAPWQAAAEEPLLAPLTGLPETRTLHEERLWSDNEWIDKDLDEILTVLVGDLDDA